MPSSLNQDDIGGAGRLALFDWQVFHGFHNRSCYQSARCSRPRFKHAELCVASFGAGSLIDVFFYTNRKCSALNFFPNWQRFETSAKTHPCQTPRSPENDEILLKFEFIVRRLQEGFGSFFFWPLSEKPHPVETYRDSLHHSLPVTW